MKYQCGTYNSHGVGAVDSRDCQRPEVKQREEVGSSDCGDSKGQSDDTLALEKFKRHHWVARKLPLPDKPDAEKTEADKESAKGVGRSPRMGVTARLESDEAANEISENA